MRRWKRQSSLYFPLNTTESPRLYMYKHMTESWRKEGRPAKNLKIQGTRLWWIPWVFFLPLSFRAEKKNSHPKEPKGMAQKSPSKSLLSLANGPGKRKLKRNSSNSNHSFPAKYYRKKAALLLPTPTKAKWGA